MTTPIINPLTPEQAESIVNQSSRCTQATLRAFGIEGYPHYGTGTLQFLAGAGFIEVRISLPTTITMKHFHKYYMNSSKNYLINTKGHAMACIGGVLVDTERKGWDRRVIEFVWEVS